MSFGKERDGVSARTEKEQMSECQGRLRGIGRCVSLGTVFVVVVVMSVGEPVAFEESSCIYCRVALVSVQD